MTRPLMLPVGLVVLLLVGAVSPSAAAPTPDGVAPSTQSVTVELTPDGSATVTLQLAYNLSTDAEREAFESLAADEPAQTATREAFASTLDGLAAEVSGTAGRPMAVTDPHIKLTTVDGGATGIVTLSVTWSNLAQVEGDRLVVAEPFASGYAGTDGPVRLVGPDGYTVAGATPAPDEVDDNSATWVGADLSGLTVTFAPADAQNGATSTAGQPGFGILVGLAGLACAALLVHRRR